MAQLSDLIDPAREAALRALIGEVKTDPAIAETPDGQPLTVQTPDPDAPIVTGLPRSDEQISGDAGPQDDEHVEVKADGKIEHKADPLTGGTQVLETDEKTGQVTALVSVTGVRDRVDDVIEPGAYTKSISKMEPIGVWSHDDKTWVARADTYRELMPGDPFFKGMKLADGSPWPAEAGGVVVDATFNLETPHGKAAFSDVKFFKGKTSWSIGYRATKATRNPRTGVRHIKELDWFEFSPVMVGANQHAMTLSVKSLAQPVDPDDDSGLLDEDERKALADGVWDDGIEPDAAALADLEQKKGNAETLRRYWSTGGEGGAKIAWGTPGDHTRCVAQLKAHGDFTTAQAHGYCNLLSKRNTGKYSGDKDSKGFDSELTVEQIALEELVVELAEAKKLPPFIKEKIENGKGGDDKDDPKRKPHPFQGDGGLCKRCMAPKGAKVHTNTKDEKADDGVETKAGKVLSAASAAAILAAYKQLGELLTRVGVLEGKTLPLDTDEQLPADFVLIEDASEVPVDEDVVDSEQPDDEAKSLELQELLERGQELKASVDLDDLFERRDALDLESKAVTERDDGRGRRAVQATAPGARTPRKVVGRRVVSAPARRRQDAEQAPPTGGPKPKGRVVRSEAGARRYGVAIGEVYTREKGTGDIERGQAGERTRAAQDKLARAGFLDEGSGRNKGRDGLFGPKTQEAVRAFQKAAGLPVTGKLDDATAAKLADHAPGGDPAGGKAPAKAAAPKKAAAAPAKTATAPKKNPDATPEGDRAATAAEDSKPSPNYEGETIGSRRAKAKAGRGKLEEDDPPETSPTGAKIVDFTGSDGRMTYADGSYFDVDGWHNVPKKRQVKEFDILVSRRLALDT